MGGSIQFLYSTPLMIAASSLYPLSFLLYPSFETFGTTIE